MRTDVEYTMSINNNEKRVHQLVMDVDLLVESVIGSNRGSHTIESEGGVELHTLYAPFSMWTWTIDNSIDDKER